MTANVRPFCSPKFSRKVRASEVYYSDELLRMLAPKQIKIVLDRFENCDWGEMDRDQKREQNQNAREGRMTQGWYRPSRCGRRVVVLYDPHSNETHAGFEEDWKKSK